MFCYFARLVKTLLAFGVPSVLAVACSSATPTPAPLTVSVRVTISATGIPATATRTRILPTATATRVPPTARPTRITPTVTATRVPLTPTRVPIKVELTEAHAQGRVKLSILGDGLESINLTLELTDDEPLEVNISPGTIFQALSAGTQSMVVRQPKTVMLKTRGVKVGAEVEVACANMELDEPGSSDPFTIKGESANPDLIKLLSLPGFTRLDFRVQQFAIWTITDNPPRDGYVGLGYSGAGSGPTSEEFDFIRFAFESAGISATKYQALR